MNLRQLSSQIEWKLKSNPSKVRLLVQAVRDIECSIQILASAGYSVHIEDGPCPPSATDWPRTYYHWEQGSREVNGPWHLAELGQGWYESPSEASWNHGRDIQFRGRGGVQFEKRPAVIKGKDAEFVAVGPSKDELKAAFHVLKLELGELGPIRSDSSLEE